MKRNARYPLLAAAMAAVLVFTAGCDRLKARDQLNKGVEAYKSARYEAAISHFQQAVQYDPTLPMARLYLATAYAQQVVPNLQTPDNLKNAQMAIEQYRAVLDKDPNDLNCLKGIAQVYFSTNQFDKAE
jgi:tetratricopeptide (TPR) repeat protein